MMQSAISRGGGGGGWGVVSIGILLVPHRIPRFFTDGCKGKSNALHRTFSTRSPPMPKSNAFIGAKY